MSELRQVYCRACRQMYFTSSPEAERCTLCGAGGEMGGEKEIAAETIRRRELKPPAQPLIQRRKMTRREYIGMGCTVVMFLMIFYDFKDPRPAWDPVWIYRKASVLLAGMGLLGTYYWPKKKSAPPAAEPPTPPS